MCDQLMFEDMQQPTETDGDDELNGRPAARLLSSSLFEDAWHFVVCIDTREVIVARLDPHLTQNTAVLIVHAVCTLEGGNIETSIWVF